jgi:hypothetical protein
LESGVLFYPVASTGLHQAEEYLGGFMAKMIEFYVPQSYRKASKWLPPNGRGEVLEFPLAVQQSA